MDSDRNFFFKNITISCLQNIAFYKIVPLYLHVHCNTLNSHFSAAAGDTWLRVAILFSLDSSQWELSELLQPIFSISYRFRDTRGPKGQKCDFWSHIKVLFFIWFWWDFFHWIPLNEIFQNCYSGFFLSLTVFEIQGAPKGRKHDFQWNVILLPNISL